MINNCGGKNLADSEIEVVIELGRDRNKVDLNIMKNLYCNTFFSLSLSYIFKYMTFTFIVLIRFNSYWSEEKAESMGYTNLN